MDEVAGDAMVGAGLWKNRSIMQSSVSGLNSTVNTVSSSFAEGISKLNYTFFCKIHRM